jgi:hypothetical protein
MAKILEFPINNFYASPNDFSNIGLFELDCSVNIKEVLIPYFNLNFVKSGSEVALLNSISKGSILIVSNLDISIRNFY